MKGVPPVKRVSCAPVRKVLPPTPRLSVGPGLHRGAAGTEERPEALCSPLRRPSRPCTGSGPSYGSRYPFVLGPRGEPVTRFSSGAGGPIKQRSEAASSDGSDHTLDGLAHSRTRYLYLASPGAVARPAP